MNMCIKPRPVFQQKDLLCGTCHQLSPQPCWFNSCPHTSPFVRNISGPAQQLIKIRPTQSSSKLPILLRMTSSSVSYCDFGSHHPMAEGAHGVKTTPTHSGTC